MGKRSQNGGNTPGRSGGTPAFANNRDLGPSGSHRPDRRFPSAKECPKGGAELADEMLLIADLTLQSAANRWAWYESEESHEASLLAGTDAGRAPLSAAGPRSSPLQVVWLPASAVY